MESVVVKKNTNIKRLIDVKVPVLNENDFEQVTPFISGGNEKV